MFNQSYTQLSFHQQIIALNQTYPCPRCNCGILEPFGHTETFQCNGCQRSFVPLRGGRLLNPAHRMGAKIAPTFWWDGLRWRWAGTTASTAQLVAIVVSFLMPLVVLNLAIAFNLLHERPEWASPLPITAAVGLMSMLLLYFMCWDFNFGSRRRARR
jgi:hypothetical protein